MKNDYLKSPLRRSLKSITVQIGDLVEDYINTDIDIDPEGGTIEFGMPVGKNKIKKIQISVIDLGNE